jgi:transposase-like protein
MQERQRRSFAEEYKRQAAELVVSSGRSITSVGKELGLRDSVLRRWVEKLRQEPESGRVTSADMHEKFSEGRSGDAQALTSVSVVESGGR